MRTRHILLTSAASVSLYFMAVNLPDAYAQKGTFLSPSSDWSVTKVAGNATAGQAGYCAVAKRYGDEAIMTIARNQSTETSFALDLQKPVFNTSQALSVTLDPGAGEQRDYSVSPASAQAFVVRLGRDEAFFNAVDRTGLLRVEVQDRSYVFNISDIELGQNKLNTCLAAKSAPSTGTTQVAHSTQQDHERFVAVLNQRIERLEAENLSLQGRLSGFDAAKLDRVAPSSGGDSNSKAELLRAQNLRLKAALQTELVEQHNEKLRVLEADNKRLSAKLSVQSDLTKEISQLQGRVDFLLNENEQLEVEAASSSIASGELQALHGDIARLEGENESLKIALSEQVENDVSEQLQQKIKRVEAENEALKSAGASSPSSTEAKISAMRLKHQQEISALQNKIQELMTKQQAAAKSDDEIYSLKGQLSSLRRDNLLLKQELSEKENAVELSSLEAADLDELSRQNEFLKTQAEKAVKARSIQDKAIAALADENVALKERIAQAPSSVDQLHQKLAFLQSKLDRAQADQVVQQDRYAALLDENVSLKSKLSSQVDDILDLAEMEGEVTRLKDEIAAKDAQLAGYEGVPERLSALLNDYKAVKAEKVALEGQALSRETLEAELMSARARNDAFEEKLEGLQDNVLAMAALNSEVKELHIALAEKKQEVVRLNGLQGQLDEALALNTSLKAEKLALASAFENAQQKSEMKIAALEERFNVEAVSNDNALVDENIKLRKTLSSALEKIASYASAIKEKDDAIEEVLAQNSSLLKDNAAKNEWLDMRSKEVASADAPSVVKRAIEKKPTAQLNDKMSAGMILASAGGVSQRAVSSVRQGVEQDKTAKVVPPKPPSKPDVKVEGRVKEVRSVAEELADIMPAAGEEDHAAVIAQNNDVVESADIVEEAQDFMERELNQAQIYEEQLKRGLNNQQVIETSREEPIEVEALEDGSADFDPIDAVIENVAASSEVEGIEEDVVEELPPMESVAEDAAENFVVDAQSEPVEVRMSQDPFEGIAQETEGQAEKVVQEVVDAVDSSKDTALPVQVKQPESAPVEMPVTEMDMADDHSAPAAISGGNDIGVLLQAANVASASNVKAVSGAENAYQWRSGNLYGSGEQKMIVNATQFDEMVKDYLSRTEERCTGDFAIVPDRSQEVRGLRIDSYEIACVGDAVSSSASLVFYNDGQRFTAIAHETEAENMDKAMMARDEVFKTLAEGRGS